MVVDVDALGYTTRAATVAYGREPTATYAAQETSWAAGFEDGRVHLNLDLDGTYRHGTPLYAKSWELTVGTVWSAGTLTLRSRASLRTELDGTEIAFDADTLAAGKKRLLAHQRERYWEIGTGALAYDALVGAGAESLDDLLPHASYAMAFTSSMFGTGGVFDGRVTTTTATSTAADGGGYVDPSSDTSLEPTAGGMPDGTATGLWAVSGTQDYDTLANFALPTSIDDPFGNTTSITYDSHKLLVTTVTNALDSAVTATLDYRTLSPHTVTDINGHDTEVAFDALGRVTDVALTGTGGDTLVDPTMRYTYDLDRYQRPEESPPTPLVVARIKAEHRETHGTGNGRWLTSYGYLGGSGQEVMAKVSAEAGSAPDLDENGEPQFDGQGELLYATADPRWVGTGRTVVDNKGNPIKQYEPYFSETEEYEDDPVLVEWGVTPLMRYDPLGRLIRTDFPDGTFATVDFDPWSQTVHDGNDTAKAGQRWYDTFSDSGATSEQQDAATKANAHADTPTTTAFDALGRAIVVKLHNLVGSPATDEFHETTSTLDIQGNLLELEDARGNTSMTHTHSMLGQVLETVSADAGTRWLFDTVTGEPLVHGGERSFTRRVAYDALRRPTHIHLDDGSTEKLVERLYYGEAHASASTNNLEGRLVAHFDQAGVLVTDHFDFKGNPLTQKRQLAEAWDSVIDYGALDTETNPETALTTAETNNLVHDDETFTHIFAYDALDRPTSVTGPDDTEVLPTYNDAGLLESVAAKVRGASTTTTFIRAIAYDAKGRRESVTYDEGDGSTSFATTTYTYDPLTFRLSHFKTERDSDSKLLQSLAYYYDAVGNITQTVDTATTSIYFTTAPTPSSASADYTYDAVYRLIEATGREHESIAGVQDDQEDVNDFRAAPFANNPNEFREYTQTYDYDEVGNLTKMVHAPVGGTNWTRNYSYASTSNRLSSIDISGGTAQSFTHDAHGNLTAMPHLSAIDWDDQDQMEHVEITSGQDVYFNYDAGGRRTRKVWITNSGNLRRERIYLGGFEVWRRYDKVGGNWVLDDERETVHISDDHRRICMVETLTWEGGSAPGTITPRVVPRRRSEGVQVAPTAL